MRRRIVAAVGLPVAAAGALAAVLASSGGGATGTGRELASARRGTEVVERRTLVESATVDGTLGYDDPRPALDRTGGTLTWLPRAGATIRAGQALFAVDERPVILLDGRVPAWRTLASGDEGEDVRQLERNLAALGYDPGTVDEDFTASTAAAVEDWQEALDVPETGRVELGDVVFLPAPRRISEVTGSLGGGSGGGGSGPNDAAWDGGADGLRTVPISDIGGATAPPASTVPPAATAPPATTAPPPTTTPPTATTPPTTTTPPTRTTPPTTATPPTTTTPPRSGSGGPAGGTPRGGEQMTPSGPAGGTPAGGGTAPGGSGDGASPDDPSPDGGSGAGTEVLLTTSTERVVTADLDAADQGLARVGGRATVELPSGRSVTGRISEVGTVATSSGDDDGSGGSGDDQEATLPVTIRLRSERGVGGLDEAPVVVELARETRRNVLAVPVAALIARPGGGYAVRVVRDSATRPVEVAVEPGMFADGYVELTDGGVRAGDRVEVPR